ncbi:AAA family ATPase [Paenibacillus taiwanensis]|uniref:AAA family ATPase n=1 Tax=Paenibacillus taiwanensis TaxID=401638 RepID=UPI000A07BD98|nr:AAA family ATPase [Paenibacillus taiwanensis]
MNNAVGTGTGTGTGTEVGVGARAGIGSNQRGPTSVGLTLGKFAPLHKGHQYMLETALREMDHVIVVIYDCPDTIDVPLPVRAGWIRQLYPSIEVIEAWDGPQQMGDTPEIKQLQEQYILRLLAGRIVTHFYSSEFYGEHMSAALGAVDRRVDEERAAYPISGTAVRLDPYTCKAYLEPCVYRDLITKVVFLGAPSTGKTTISSFMSKATGSIWMPEYGREYWENNQIERRLTLEQLVEIAEGHLEREEAQIQEARNFLWVDTNAITTYMFSLYYHGKALPRLEQLAQQAATRYDLVFVCEDDIPYDDTWDRSGDVQRHVFQKQIKTDLILRNIPFIPLKGTLEQRASTVSKTLAGYKRYSNLPEWIGKGYEV